MCSSKNKNWKIYWSWARGPVLIVRTACYFHWTWNGTILSALKSNNSHKRYNFRIMATMFLSNQDEMRKSYKGPSIDTSCRISLYLAKRFHQWRTWKSTNQKKILQAVSSVENMEIDQPEKKWPTCILTNSLYWLLSQFF